MIVLYFIICLVLAALLIALLVAFAMTLLFIFPMAKGAVYVPSKDLAIETMLSLAKVKKNMPTVDLGSGDGRVVAAFAHAGASADGYEINPWLVFKAKRRLSQLGFGKKTRIYLQSYWNVDLSKYQVVTVYGITYIMESLEEKLLSELKPGTLVISNYFTFPTWKKLKTINGIHLYKV